MVYGVVTDGFAYSDLVTPMHAVIGADGDPVAAGLEPSQRAEIRLFTAAVLRQMPEEPLQPVPLGAVWLASDADVVLALRMDAYTGRRARRPAFRSGSTPPAASSRRSISTATSCSAPRPRTSTSPASRDSPPRPARSSSCSAASSRPSRGTRARVAALCFNVKGPDLCFLDQPAALDRRGPPPVRPARAPARALRRRALLRAVQGRRREPQYAAHPRGAGRRTPAARLGTARGARLRRGGAQSGRRRRQGRRLHRFPRRAGRGPRVPGRHAARQAVPGAELRRSRGVLPRDLRFHGGAGRRAGRCGRRITSRPSGRSGIG